MAKVKICGITDLEDALHAIECGADELGFNFYTGSKRYVSPEDAGEIIARLPASARTVGVFVNEPLENLLSIADIAGLNKVQVHGDEDLSYVADLCDRTSRTVIKAFRVTPTFDVGEALEWPSDFTLFDTHSAANYGGTGEKFDWDEFGSEITLWFPDTAYMAGGLNPDNVADAIRTVQPYAVDVASGVESSPGKKDPKKVEAFIRNAKST